MTSRPSRTRYGPCLIAAMYVFLAVKPAAAGPVTIVDVSVDTSAIAGGTAGNLYFSFSPGIGITDSATATISDFTMNNVVYAGNEVFDGDASAVANAGGGPVPNDYVINNTSFLNDASFDITFNTPPSGISSLSFEIALTGAAIDSPSPSAESGSTFSFQLSGPASAGYPPLLGDPEVVGFTLPAGSDTPILTRQAPEATVTFFSPTAVPEPSTFLLATLGMIFLALSAPLGYDKARR